jgi:hypothetical protein
MRLWVHVLWLQTNRQTVLQTAGPREDAKLEALINQYGEHVVAFAWHKYVNADPRPYNLSAVQHVDRFNYTDKRSGQLKTMVNQVEDQGAITRFPLSAFLAVAEGYLVTANMASEELEAKRAELGRGLKYQELPDPAWAAVIGAMKKRMTSVKEKWGAAVENGEDY